MGQMQRKKRLARELSSKAPLKVFWQIPLYQRMRVGMAMAKAYTEMRSLHDHAVSYFRKACSAGENHVRIKHIGRNTTIETMDAYSRALPIEASQRTTVVVPAEGIDVRTELGQLLASLNGAVIK